jgi:membrane-associated phospholipid phosphatase
MTIARRLAPLLTVLMLGGSWACAQTPSQLIALQGLAPMSALAGTEAGKAALVANLEITAKLQQGSAQQPMLQPFAAQQQQALRDAFTTAGNAADLADGLGSTLGGAYQSVARYTSTDGGRTFSVTSVSPAVAQVLLYAYGTSHSDSGVAKFFFANGTLDGKTPASAEALAVFTQAQGTPDAFGKAYNLPAGSEGGDDYGNSRPFQTRRGFLAYDAQDYFGGASSNTVYLRGPVQDLTDSPSFPSGHSTYAYTEALVLALLVPERYPQLVARAAEYSNSRIIVGAHYAMDVLAGRTLAEHDLAQLLAGRSGYAGVQRRTLVIEDFVKALAGARADLDKALAAGCGHSVVTCARQDESRFASAARDAAFYESTQTYGLPVVHSGTAGHAEDVGRLAPEAGYLLTVAFPYLTLAQADDILTATEGPGGGFLDNGSAFGVYSRLDLYRAAQKAQSLAPKHAQAAR